VEGRRASAVCDPLVSSSFLTPFLLDYLHKQNGDFVRSEIVRHTCETKMHIWWPQNKSIRKAIVLMKDPHSHPMHPTHKMTLTARDEYVQLVREIGVIGASVVKVDKCACFLITFKKLLTYLLLSCI
jgi:hypothetical protein